MSWSFGQCTSSLMDILLNRTYWFILLGGIIVVVLVVFVIRQKRKLGKGPSPSVESENATGTKLLFFRELGDATYLATVWVIVMGLPIAPLSTWRVFPRDISTRRTGRSLVTSYNVTFMERKPLRVTSVAFMYLEILFHVTVMFGPSVLMITLFVACTEWVRMQGSWVIMLIPAAVIGGLGYGLFLGWRYNRRFGKGLW